MTKIKQVLTRYNKAILSVLIFSVIPLTACSAAAKAPAYKKDPSCKTLRVMARVYMSYGEFTKARPLAEKALSLAQQRNVEDSELCMCLLDLAYIYNSQKNFTDAEKMCLLGIDLQKKVYYDRHPYVAYTLRTLSSIYAGQGKYEQAEEALDTAFAIMLENHQADDPVIAPFEVDMAGLFVTEGKLSRAQDYYTKAFAAINESFGPDHLYTATVAGSFAELCVLQGKYDQAESLIDKSQSIQERIYGSDNHLIAPVWLTKAKICRAKGNFDQAEILIARARSAVQKTGSFAALVGLEKNIEVIRTLRPVVFGSAAKPVDSST